MPAYNSIIQLCTKHFNKLIAFVLILRTFFTCAVFTLNSYINKWVLCYIVDFLFFSVCQSFCLFICLSDQPIILSNTMKNGNYLVWNQSKDTFQMLGYLDWLSFLSLYFKRKRRNQLNVTSYLNVHHVRAQGELSYHHIKVPCNIVKHIKIVNIRRIKF